MNWVVCPCANVSELVVRPLNAMPETAVPPSVTNGTVTVSLTSLTVLVPTLAT